MKPLTAEGGNVSFFFSSVSHTQMNRQQPLHILAALIAMSMFLKYKEETKDMKLRGRGGFLGGVGEESGER